MYDELPHLSEHLVSVVPDAVEFQNLAIHLKELSQLVKVSRCLVGPQLSGLQVKVMR